MTKELKEKAIKYVEEVLESKQKNKTIKTNDEEAVFLCGAMAVIHAVFSKDMEKMDSVPPRWVFAPMSGRSINEYNYKK